MESLFIAFFKCEMCNMPIASEDELARHWSANHNRIYPFYCPTCHVSTNLPEAMFEHLKTKSHQPKPEGQYTPFCRNLPRLLKKLMSISGCNVCNKSFPQPILENALQHYKSERHESAVCHWFKENRKLAKSDPKMGPSGSKLAKSNKKMGPSASLSLESLKDADFQMSSFCYVCKKTFLKSEKTTHVRNFPHNELIKIKLTLVKQGVSEDFWRKYQEGFSCRLCDAKLTGVRQFEDHFKCSYHKARFQEWFENATLSQPDFREKIKWFYCYICDQDLYGTSDASNHYTGLLHQKYASTFCQICVKQFHSVNQLKRHNKSEHHEQSTALVTTFCVSEKNNQSSSNSVTSESSVQSSLGSENLQLCKNPSQVNVQNSSEQCTQEPASENKLKERVFNELQKLIQKLYYSKTVPYEYGLDYLKNINKKIEQVGSKLTPNSTDDDTFSQDRILNYHTGCSLTHFNFFAAMSDENIDSYSTFLTSESLYPLHSQAYLEGLNATLYDSGSDKKGDNIKQVDFQENEFDDEVSLKSESINQFQIETNLLDDWLLESNGSTSFEDLSTDENIVIISPELIDTKGKTSDHIDLCLPLSDTFDYLSAKEENGKESSKVKVDIEATEINDQNIIKYSYTMEELNRPRSSLKVDPHVKTEIDR